jgi:hypothetical protein
MENLIKIIKPLIMEWDPQVNISSYELARCLNYLGKTIYPNELPSIPECIQRHFKIQNPN